MYQYTVYIYQANEEVLGMLIKVSNYNYSLCNFGNVDGSKTNMDLHIS